MATTRKKNADVVTTEQRLLNRLRPTRLPIELESAYEAFELLLLRLLRRDDEEAGIKTMLEELADSKMRDAAVYYGTEFSFFVAAYVVLHDGPVDWGSADNGKKLWPPLDGELDTLAEVKLLGTDLYVGSCESL